MMGVEPGDDRLHAGPAQGPYFGAQPFPDPPDRRLARLDQQLAVIPADVKPEEVDAFIEGDDAASLSVALCR